MKKFVLSKDQKRISEQYYLFARENQAKGSGAAQSYENFGKPSRMFGVKFKW